jgi:RNA polymerase sigma-70 factor (ECF subfamily)
MSKELNFLILKSKKGNQRAQIKLYDLFCEAMFFISCRYLKNEEEAKDAMQDAFLKAFLNLESYKEDTSFGSWLKKIIINQCLDVIKKKKLETVSLENHFLEIVEDDTSWEYDLDISKKIIENKINQLPDKYKTVLQLYLIEGYDHSEISDILKIPIKTSRTHLRRGKTLLRDQLKKPKYEARY